MSCGSSRRIETPDLGPEPYSRNPKRHDPVVHLRREVTLQPDEAALSRKLGVHVSDIQVGKDGAKTVNGIVHVNNPPRLCEQRVGLQVDRELPTMAVEDGRPMRGDLTGCGPSNCRPFKAELDQSCTDCKVSEHQGQSRNANPRLRQLTAWVP